MSEASLGHVGLYVTDMDKMTNFFTQALGFIVTDVDPEEKFTFLTRTASEHHQVVLVAGREPNGKEMVNQVSFKVASLEQVQEVYKRIVASAASDLRPVTHGIAWSIYFRDPEGNRLEFFTDTPWYIAQPCRIPIDLSRPAADLRRETGEYCKTQPGFRSIEDWRAEFTRKLAAVQ
jgi:catechol 2,3-dioxygenase